MQTRQPLLPGRVSLIVLLVVAVFLYTVRQILPPFVVGAAIAYILSPVIGAMQARLHVGRIAATALFYLVLLAVLAALGVWLGPTLFRDVEDLIANTPRIIRELLSQVFGGETVRFLGQTFDAETLTRTLTNAVRDAFGTPQEAAHVVTRIGEGVFQAFLSLVIAFYFLVDGERFTSMVIRLAPAERQPRFWDIAARVDNVLRRYLRGILFLIVFMSAATWLGLALLFRQPYALVVGIATGFLEIIPFVGPVTAGAIATVVALTHGGVGHAVAVVIFYTLLRQLEDNLVAPQVLGRAV
ncbi:MAG: AI-2E family transporter, partial [Chloroflexota bacterium]